MNTTTRPAHSDENDHTPGHGRATSTGKRILVGTDGSDDSLRAVPYAAQRAAATGARLQLLHVVDEGGFTGSWGMAYDVPDLQAVGQRIIDDSARVAAEAGLDPTRIEKELAIGLPGDALARYSGDADLLVVGRRSLSGVSRVFVGSTSAAVADTASCPVIVVSAAHAPNREAHRRITVAIRASSRPSAAAAPRETPQALVWAFEEAAGSGAELQVVHVVRKDAPLGGVREPDPDSAAEQVIGQVLQPLREAHPDVRVSVRVVNGAPTDVLVDLSAHSELLVLGKPRPGIHLGGTMRGILAHSLCPVAVIR